MTAKEYLQQSYRLDQKINSDIAEAARLREIASSISAPAFGERVQSSQPGEAPFVRRLEKVMELEETIDREIDLYVDLKQQIRDAIATVSDSNEQLVLRYRYILGYSWEKIGTEMHAERTTIYRWHGSALQHLEMPKKPIII